MTRCYEYYCMDPAKCQLSKTGKKYVNSYIRFMQKHGVEFNKTPGDKELFYDLMGKFGTEYKINQGQELGSRKIEGIDYLVLLCDPPWEYEFSIGGRGDPERHYPVMQLEDLKRIELPITKNTVLYLWATAPKLIEALEVMRAWGFEYKTHIIWDKMLIGTGYWSRGQHELLLIGTIGNISPPDKSKLLSSILREKRTEHSTKPTIVYEMIEQQFPDTNKMELFARSKRDGWMSWGNEIED